jgi:hypothetical protein
MGHAVFLTVLAVIVLLTGVILGALANVAYVRCRGIGTREQQWRAFRRTLKLIFTLGIMR